MSAPAPAIVVDRLRINVRGTTRDIVDDISFEIAPGEHVIGIDNGGGGYGDPLDRDVQRVREDVIERWVTRGSAEHIYGVLFTGKEEDETLAVDLLATAKRRDELRHCRDNDRAAE